MGSPYVQFEFQFLTEVINKSKTDISQNLPKPLQKGSGGPHVGFFYSTVGLHRLVLKSIYG